MLILSSMLFNLPAQDVLLKRRLSTLVNKIRHAVLLITILIPIDLFFFSWWRGTLLLQLGCLCRQIQLRNPLLLAGKCICALIPEGATV
eukprot:scaffold119149_cov18-Tisochrysis_lutea.AAC.2